ncbi:Diaminohydroxyphosphoribosylamino-pyrimidine deaminase [Fusarium oxysporum f. sp. albedinis]|nr:Diaminohydroxyphosphoribosylamino-pyrimidine deaminase [Fusarium oxysporum f. sp. albedinis]
MHPFLSNETTVKTKRCCDIERIAVASSSWLGRPLTMTSLLTGPALHCDLVTGNIQARTTVLPKRQEIGPG